MTVPAEVHRLRRDQARQLVAERTQEQPSWLILTSLPNIRYLTGFSGSNAVLALHTDDASRDLIGTDGRYAEQVAVEAPGLPALIDRSTLQAVLAAIAAALPHPVGQGSGFTAIESTISLHGWQLVQRIIGSTPLVTEGLVEELRMVKDPVEVAALEAACRITAEAFEALLPQIRPGLTEISIARRLEQLFGDLGAEDRAFETIVGSGPHSAIPHHQCGMRTLQSGDLLVIDAGALVDGYHADMTRTVVVGKDPAPWQQEIHAVVADAQARALATVQHGAFLAQIDASARTTIESAGFGEAFSHGLGHGVGLEIHEAPMISARATGTITAGTPITIEPGIYLAGRGGVRIEDTVLVTTEGARVLTPLPRDLAAVG